jgi:hypothetical protein
MIWIRIREAQKHTGSGTATLLSSFLSCETLPEYYYIWLTFERYRTHFLATYLGGKFWYR